MNNLEGRNFRLAGRAKNVFTMLTILASTEPIETCRQWWAVRAIILAHDMDKKPQPPMWQRRN